MSDSEPTRAEKDVIATTDSYGGPVSDDELAQVYLAGPQAHSSTAEPGTAEPGTAEPADVDSDPARDDEDNGSDWTDEGGATPQGPAVDSSTRA